MPSAKSKKKAKPPELKVVFDTNVLWTGSASDLLKQEVLELINANSHHSDLSVTWCLPDVVRHERQFQMLRQSLELLPSIQKLERLLGHNLNITEQIIEQRVQEAVERQIKEIGLHVLSLDPANIDWKQMMLNSAYRLPPFSPGEKEKGFRDALVAEEFIQLVTTSPVTPKVCRVALVTGDSILAEAVEARTSSATNVRILLSVEELKGLINILVAEISEEFAANIQAKAQSYFFATDQNETLYYKENISNRIREAFQSKLSEVPQGAETRENGTWRINPPRFIKKQGQRVFWVTRFSIEAEAYKYVSTTTYEPLSLGTVRYMSPSDIVRTTFDPNLPLVQNPAAPIYGSTRILSLGETRRVGTAGAVYGDPSPSVPNVTRTKSLVMKGKSIIEVTWSVAVTMNGNFSSPKIESIDHIETVWEGV